MSDRGGATLRSGVVDVDRADEEVRSLSGDAVGRDACVFWHFPAKFGKEPLLRVRSRCHARRDAEEVSIEAGHLAE